MFDNVGGETTKTSFSLLARGGTLASYAIVDAVNGTGPLMAPFMKAIGHAVLWSALPNGRKATF